MVWWLVTTTMQANGGRQNGGTQGVGNGCLKSGAGITYRADDLGRIGELPTAPMQLAAQPTSPVSAPPKYWTRRRGSIWSRWMARSKHHTTVGFFSAQTGGAWPGGKMTKTTVRR